MRLLVRGTRCHHFILVALAAALALPGRATTEPTQGFVAVAQADEESAEHHLTSSPDAVVPLPATDKTSGTSRNRKIAVPAVARNQIVVLLYSHGGLEIRTEARALGEAGIGEDVRVLNISSRRAVHGTIVADGVVLVRR